jgi:O-antigen ligase
MLTRTDAILSHEADVYFDALAPEPQAYGTASGFLIGFMIWIPGIAIAIIFHMMGQTIAALGVLAFSSLLHTLFQTRVSAYALIASICLLQIITLGDIGSIGKYIGLVAGLVSLPKIAAAARSPRKDPIVKWVVPFVLVGFLVFPLSPLPVYSLILSITMLLVYSMPLILCVHLVREEYVTIGLVVFTLTSLIIAIMFLKAGSAEVVEGWRRAELTSITTGEGGSGDMSEQARLMAVGVLTTIFFFFSWRGLLKKAACVAVGFVLCLGIVISKSRACYIGLPAAVVLGFLFNRHIGLSKRVVTITTSAVLLVLVFIIGGEIGFFGEGIQKRVDSIFEEGVTAGGRNVYWKAHLEVTTKRTGLMGNGIAGAILTPELARDRGVMSVAHNNIIDVISDLGVAGLFLFIAIYVNLLRRIRKLRFRNEQLFGFMVMFFLIFAGLSQKDYLRKYYCLSLGLVLIVTRLAERRAVEEDLIYGSGIGSDDGYALPNMPPIGQ